MICFPFSSFHRTPLTHPLNPLPNPQAVSSPSISSSLFHRRGLASLPGYVTSAPAAITSKLSNGISVATEAGPDDLAVVSVWIEAGSRYEAPSLSGASNLIARLALKGYENEVAKIGGAVKAWTSREMTVVSATVLKADVAAATTLLGQVVTNPKFGDADVDAEKAAVLAEMESVTVDAHEQLLFEHLHATAFQVSFSFVLPFLPPSLPPASLSFPPSTFPPPLDLTLCTPLSTCRTHPSRNLSLEPPRQ